jgi:hypothetical protein
LDYFNARYYDPVVGVFLAADTAQGSLVSSFNNSQGGAMMKSNQLFGPYGNNGFGPVASTYIW